MNVIVITINGERLELPGSTTDEALLKELGLETRRVAVELNRRILKRAEPSKVSVTEGDSLEVVHFVGGG